MSTKSFILAIHKLYPNIEYTVGNIAYDIHNNVVEYDDTLISAEIEANLYKDQRSLEYPPLTDLADAMYWSSQGDNTKLEAYYAACEAVKQKYPKVSQ